MGPFKAFIFDLNGTMINDMHYHELAWYEILVTRLKAPLTLEQVKQQIYGKSEEMFERIFGAGRFSKEEIQEISSDKEKRYRQEFLQHLKLINGLNSYLEKAKRSGIDLAIGTAAPSPNVDFVLDNLSIRSYFPVIIGSEDVINSKPHPEVFLEAARKLGIPPENCIVFEDAPRGIEAAYRAGMKAIAVTSYHSAKELMLENVLYAIDNYFDENLNGLF